MIALALALPLVPAPCSDAARPSGQIALHAAWIHPGDGPAVEDGVVVLADGRIAAVASGDGALERALADAGLERDDVVVEESGHLSAGLIAAHDGSGAGPERYDATRAVLEGARLAYAFDPLHSDFRRLVEEGITTIVLAPGAEALSGGVTAVVKTSGGEVLSDQGHLHLSFTSEPLRPNRYPTSYAGALDELAERFAEPRGAFAQALSGELPVLIDAYGKHEIARAVEFARERGLHGALYGASRGGELASTIAEAGLGVVFRPFDVGLESRSLRSVAELAKAGVPFAFSLDADDRDPVSLRLAAAACVRAGLEPQAAWRALTVDAARIAGVEDRVGRIAAGLDADLVVWSGDPLDLTSSVQSVYVGGRRVFGGER